MPSDTYVLTISELGLIPVSQIAPSTSLALGVGSIELGHATDTTILRSGAGRISVEGANVVTVSSTDTLTNKTLTAPTLTSPTLTSPTLTGAALGTPLTGILTNCTGLPLTSGAGVTGTLPVTNGGTGAASLTGYVKANGTAMMTASASVPVGEISGTLPVTNGGTGVTQSAYGEYYISTIAATTIATPNTFVKIAGTTTAGTTSNFTNSSNRLTYTGTATRKFLVSSSISFHGTSGNDYKFAIYKSTSTAINSSSIVASATGAGNLVHALCQCIVELANNDYIEVFVANMDASNNATVDWMNVSVTALI